jgi:hypothetical protein
MRRRMLFVTTSLVLALVVWCCALYGPSQQHTTPLSAIAKTARDFKNILFAPEQFKQDREDAKNRQMLDQIINEWQKLADEEMAHRHGTIRVESLPEPPTASERISSKPEMLPPPLGVASSDDPRK